MTLPPEVREALEETIGVIDAVAPVGGGCIGSARRIVVGGASYFLKYDRVGAKGFFGAEAAGLEALRARAGGEIRIPRVIGHRDGDDEWGWILLEWLDTAPASVERWSGFGAGLARLHRARAEGWGWEREGFIGALPQSNAPTQTWARFWAERRLGPQLELAGNSPGIGSRMEWDLLLSELPRLLQPAESDGPSSLHGDLWSGNVLMTADGAAIVDPAHYRGHREVDLAMAALFGGFPDAFHAAYEATWPLQPGDEVRRSVYQLYYLLVHVNLFGSSYASRTAGALRSVLTSL